MLRVEGVAARYGTVEVLRGVSLEVVPRSVVALLGGNGAGKTTTMRAIMGLLPITGGSIEFRGARLDGSSPHKVVRRGLALVSQDRDLFPEMTVAENLELGALSLSSSFDKEALLHDQLESFPRLRERLSQPAGTLSGGERAMLAVARALMSKPELLLLDEPTCGLAPIVVSELGRAIVRLSQAGQTILLVEQNIRLALRVSQHVYAIRNGRIDLSAKTSEVSEDELAKSYLL
ncbi:ABC transporter ATP-binding protein [Bradyrhizobium sp. NP1]|uniref:ABC transporter ATP-binding protein n=1 Tax=Bradyrhizobium sp. NP1 TaxID=3049772 RepID=UPI0025A5A507|nr:ABC transporter ATP-binding protein [Bradyrhizobium sp. NP1]WJR80321.1 ABC transporter ATP-binding protein [Bradyrhizobium sp. NP1]